MTPPTSPDDRADLLLESRVERVFRELPGALAGQEEPIHQVRVAGRRLRVALPLLARKGESRPVGRAAKVLRQLTRAVGAGRDMDVILGLFVDRLAALQTTSAEQRALLSRLRAARARSRTQVAEDVLDLDIDGLRRNLRRLLNRGAADAPVVLARVRAVREAEGTQLLRGFSHVGERFRPVELHALLPARAATPLRGRGRGHSQSLKTYRDGFHGQASALGFTRVAACADCHGSHDIRPMADPASRVHKANLVQTCGRCHPGASESYVKYDPHAEPHDKERSAPVYYTTLFMQVLLAGVFSFFGLHVALWFPKEVRVRRARKRAPAARTAEEPAATAQEDEKDGDQRPR